MNKEKNIIEALRYLPEELISEDIVQAALASQNVKVLNYLPEQYLTAGNIEKLIEQDKESYGEFDLSRIPKKFRTKAVCQIAVDRGVRNVKFVPRDKFTHAMAESFVNNIGYHVLYVRYIPSHLWDRKLAYKVITKLYGWNLYSYSRNNGEMKLVQVFCSFLPSKLKNQSFYMGLFKETSLNVKDVNHLTPVRYKNRAYYMRLAEYCPSFIPLKYFDKEMLMSIFNREYSHERSAAYKNKQIWEVVLELMDAKMADAIVKQDIDNFGRLPKKYQTSKRLALAIRHSTYRRTDLRYLLPENDTRLLNAEVCKAMVCQGVTQPEYPAEVWSQEFVDYCMKNAKQFEWLRIMPKKFQTQEMIDSAIRAHDYNAKYSLNRFISPQTSRRIFRATASYKDFLPKHHFTEFEKRTGLSEEFYGGELTLSELKNQKAPFTYTKIGNTYIGYYTVGKYDDTANHLVMMRTTSRYMKPEKVFDVKVGTFHKTWLEKIITDYDPELTKPQVDKSLKDVQAVCYYGVEHVCKDNDGTDIYRNTFLGQMIGYCAKREELTYHCDNLEDVREGLERKIKGMDAPSEEKGVNVVLTAIMLHEKYNFCEIGMSAFAQDYNLDINAAYTVGQLRQLVSEKGHLPSVHKYHRELKKIHII